MRSVAAFLVVALIWFSGLLAYAGRVQHSTPNRAPAPAHGIVALTGANSNERLAAAMGLLEDGYGRRVLVSGVNPMASRADVRRVSKAVRRLYDCCVDLGFTAADTVGNARETLAWAEAMRYRKLIIVTADYHMPRAMLELNAVLFEGTQTLIHGDCHPEQFWVAHGQVVLFDFDEFALGDPMEDLAAFVTKVSLLSGGPAFATAMLAAYSRHAPTRFDGRRLHWHLAVQQLLQAGVNDLGGLVVAVDNPLNFNSLDAIQAVVQREVEFVCTTPTALNTAASRGMAITPAQKRGARTR